MKLTLSLILLSITFFIHSAQNEWQDDWLTGLEYLDNNEFIQAKTMFEHALSSMSEEEIQESPDVLINLANTDFLMGNVDETLRQAEKLITFPLSDVQRLICGNLIVSALWNKGLEEKAVEKYFEYIASSPMASQCYFREDKIIINKVPSFGCYRDLAKASFIDKFCENNEDFQEYGDLWAIKRTKKCSCSDKQSIPSQPFKRVDSKRTAQAIRGCCNTCSTLSVGGNLVCARVPHYICKTACVFFIEALRQTCEGCCYNGGYDEKCWENFSFWKDDFYNKNRSCSHPNDWH